MRIVVCILMSVFEFTTAHGAETMADRSLLTLMKARTPTALANALQDETRLQHLQSVCEAQLRGSRIPTACFAVLKSERTSLNWLEALCIERVRHSVDWKEIAATADESAVPEACRQAARMRDGDLRYSDASEHPAELFRRRPAVDDHL